MVKTKKQKIEDDDEIPENILDPELYREALSRADESYKSHSAYKSMFVVRTYKNLGGEYKKPTKTQPKTEKTNVWREEEWIQITPYLNDKEKIPCGRTKERKPNACRPLKNIRGKPKNATMADIIDLFGKEKVRRLTDLKLEDMDGRLDWENGTFTPSHISKKRIAKRAERKEERKMGR